MESSLFDTIRRYYTNRLSESERTAFEERLSTDENFRKEVIEQARIYQLIQEEGDAELMNRLSQLGQTLLERRSGPVESLPASKPKPMSAFPRTVYIVAAAAAVILAIAVPMWLMQPAAPERPKTVAELYSANFSLPSAPRLRDVEAIPPWKEAYMAGEYEAAIGHLEDLLARPDYDFRSEAYLYLGLCYLAIEQPENALDAFRQVSSSSFDYEDAQWYQALAYLKLDQIDQARPLLKEIAGAKDGAFEAQARQLLADL